MGVAGQRGWWWLAAALMGSLGACASGPQAEPAGLEASSQEAAPPSCQCKASWEHPPEAPAALDLEGAQRAHQRKETSPAPR